MEKGWEVLGSSSSEGDKIYVESCTCALQSRKKRRKRLLVVPLEVM